jgi:hypothetical protein
MFYVLPVVVLHQQKSASRAILTLFYNLSTGNSTVNF